MPLKPKKYDALLEASKAETLVKLLDDGIDTAFTQPIIDRLRLNVKSGGTMADLISELDLIVNGDEDRLGVLERYYKQVASDSLTQFNQIYSEAIVDDLGYEFYIYDGNLIRDSRDFCVERVGNYYHEKEIEAWADEDWQGKIATTTESSIFIDRGGYNCRHVLTAVPNSIVPTEVLQRNLDNGNWQPSENELAALGL